MKPFLTLNKNISIALVTLFLLLFANYANANCNFHAQFSYSASSSNCKTINFTNSSYITNASDSGVSYLWKFGTTTFASTKNSSYTFSGNGTYTICLIMYKQTSGGICSDTLCQSVTVNCNSGTGCNFGSVGFEWTRNCNNQTISFYAHNSDSNGTYKYKWSFGNQQYDTSNTKYITHTYPNTGSYTVCLNIRKYLNGTVCKDTTICKTITVAAPVKPAYFSYSATSANCKQLVFNITDTNSCAIYRWYWGDGTSSMQTSKYPFNHTYANTGTYTVCVKAMSCADTTCSITKCNTVTVHCNTTACNLSGYFSYTVTCPSRVAAFTSYIADTSGTYGYYWNFGDNTTASTKNASHTYANNGNYTVCLTIKRYTPGTNIVCKDTTICKTVSVNCGTNTSCALSGSWSFNVNCPSRTVTFTGHVADSTGTYAYLWNFGDNSTPVNAKNATRTYANNGTYTVCLTIKRYTPGTNIVCKDTTICKTVVVNCGTNSGCTINAYWGYQVYCPSREVKFTTYIADSPGTYSYHWSFGNTTNPVTTKNPVYTFPNNGTYTVCLTIKRYTPGTNTVCKDTVICKTITVNCHSGCNLHASFTPHIICATRKVEVQNLSYGDSCFISKWSWGDGTYSHDRNPPSHVYANAGTYTVCLTVKKCSDTTCVSTICKTVVIPAKCCDVKAYFGAGISCPNKKVEVVNYSHGDTCMTYKWSWGDGTYSTAKNPGSHVYTSPGTYSVCLKVTKCNDSTCYNIFCKTIIIPATCCPTPAFYFYNFCNTFRFINTTVGGTSYWWSFGDSSYSAQKSPLHSYLRKGTYTVCLTVFDSVRNCTTKVCKNIVVRCSWWGSNHHFEVPLSDDNIGDASKLDQGNGDLTPSKGLQVNNPAGISAYPNPTNSMLNIVLPATSATIKITDITGATLMQFENVSSFYKADVSHLAAGIYFVNVINENGTQSVRFMKN